MSILVAYASKHGATREIAERIAATLQAAGLDVETRPMKGIKDLSGYDAFVVGSAVYFGKWLKEAVAFVRHHEATLAGRAVWLFSSGPLGTETTDAEGHDVREEAEPKELPEFVEAVKPRDHRVFFGKLDPTTFGLTERIIYAMPTGKELLKEGDFRDWDNIEVWSVGIAHELAGVTAAAS